MMAQLGYRWSRFMLWCPKSVFAFFEVLTIVFFSFTPAIFLASQRATAKSAPEGIFWPTLVSTIKNGQLILFTWTMLGTMVWLILPIWGNNRFVVLRSFLTLVVIFLAIWITSIGGYDPTYQNPNPSLVTASVYIYALSLIVYVFLKVINDPPAPDLGKTFRKDEEALEQSYYDEISGRTS
jgi:hypothetical protein